MRRLLFAYFSCIHISTPFFVVAVTSFLVVTATNNLCRVCYAR
nr:MAG TPA: zinc finger protein [Caudoviricetes sp.]DAR55739.1 MAG TPA: zinc finger protein [Caudoviricetes sp.]DAT72721.1 MAG TPA: zinc finger protein [Caudoviricetes sp.]DAU74218.1 MAG TPA: zinc finger protein [Caudoviricetes sp.]